MEVMTGCEKNNKYKVFASDNEGNMMKKVPIFKCKEDTDCM